VTVINDSGGVKQASHLLKYDSTLGTFNADVKIVDDSTISVNGKPIKIVSSRDPTQLPWAAEKIDLVIEGTDGRLAVECDGEFWHGPDAFADDMVRQRQLERAGWTFERVRESAFYADRQAAIDKVVAACLALDVRPWPPEGSAT